MKKILICALVFLSAALFQTASAQLQANNNTSVQPKWAPSGNNHIEYLYLPEIDTYYYVPRKQFIYQTGGHWTFSSSLPADHKSYNLYTGNKVVVNEVCAYRFNTKHKTKYAPAQTSAKSSETNDQKNKNKQVPEQEKIGG